LESAHTTRNSGPVEESWVEVDSDELLVIAII
jgi:hypothetical protein